MTSARSARLFLCFVFGFCMCRSSVAATARKARIALELTDATPITRMEDGQYQRIEFKAESLGYDGSTVTPVDNGDLKIPFVMADVDGESDVEPGFDFTPSLGPLPATFTVTIKEGESESNLAVFQVLDDCHEEAPEKFMIHAAESAAYTTGGSVYHLDTTDTVEYVITEQTSDSAGTIQIHMDPEFPTVGFVFFEGEPNPRIPVKGLECSATREVPLDDICSASLERSSGDLTDDGQFMVQNMVKLDSDDNGFSIVIADDSVAEDPQLETTLHFASAACTGSDGLVSQSLDEGTEFQFTIIDDDEETSYGIVYPAAIGRKESRDVNVYAVTSHVNTDTDISRNDATCPYTTHLPFYKTTDLKCGDTDTIGQRFSFPKPRKQSRDRFGSYTLSIDYDPVQKCPVFVSPLSDVLQPLKGPTITINNLEDVVIGVKFSDYVHELRWYFNGKELSSYRGKCNFKLKGATYGVHDGYYEVNRVHRGDNGYRAVIRLIIRRCEANQHYDVQAPGCVASTNVCFNGGVLGIFEDKCVCPLGFYGPMCDTVDPRNFRVGPLSKALSCRDIDRDIPRDCKGALFCFQDPLGCLCARGYWGPKCDRVCPHGRFGWSCLQRCHCVGPWDSCDPKTGICASEACADGYTGPNCQSSTAT